ncbi:MAG: tRNA pseudouridine(55) synthase TruB [Bacteroidota bacterium]|nr:tRNA pseudouridine(55) synthase TruB [Bacteroidota bacterium]
MSDILVDPVKQFYEEGQLLLIDKPKGWTSFDVVNKLRYATKVKKIGHAGTLDPLATGLLIICTGKMTKQIDTFQAQTKTYEGEMVFGHTTPSYDAETEFDKDFEISHLTKELIVEKLKDFTGIINQFPPMYSAIKVDGKRLYDIARKGKTIELVSREVRIDLFELLSFEIPRFKFKVICSKGTYIRSLVHDLAKSLQSGAYLTELRRIGIGNYNVKDALSVEQFLQKNKELREKLIV